MIQREVVAGIAAILAGVTVAAEDIAAGEGDFFVGDADVVAQANHSGEGKPCVDVFAVVLDLLCFAFN